MPMAIVSTEEPRQEETEEQLPDHRMPFEASVVAVEVFRNSALVHREGTLDPAQRGESCHEIGGLPLGLMDSSVRVALESQGPRVLDVQVILDVHSPVEQVEVEELERYKELERKLERLRREQRRLAEQSAALGKLVPMLPPAPKRPDQDRFAAPDPLAAWLALDRFVQEQSSSRLKRGLDLEHELKRLGDELKQAADRLGQLSSARTAGLRIGKKIQVWLAEPLHEPRRIRLSYQVPGARWFPSYELRVEQDGARAELVMSALVGQATGEDWQQVAISLSTADLRRRCDLPRLGAWRIGRAAPPDRHRAWRELPQDLPQLFADFDRDRPIQPEPLTKPSGAIGQMISQTLAGAKKAPSPVAGRMEDEPSYSAAEITRETMVEVEEEVDLEQAFDDEPTPQDKLMELADHGAPAEPAMAAMPAPAPQSAPAQMMKRRSAARPAKRKREERRREPAQAATLVPSDELLAFSGLVLPSADERGRGTLRPLRSEEQLPSGLRQPEVLGAVQQAEQRRASRVLELRTLPAPRGSQDVGQSAGHFAYRYETRSRADLPADGALHRLAVLRQTLDVKLICRTVPLVDSAVYRLARLENPLGVPLLAGPLDVFWGNDYLVTARLQTTAPGASIEASLGVEPRIKTARNVRHSQHEEGLLSGRTVYDEEVRIEVKNGLQQPSVVEVIERLPVTEERKVEVKRLEEKPPAEDYDQRERQRPIRGGRRFRLQLGPGEKRECLLRYSVTLPSSNEIVGGGRRA